MSTIRQTTDDIIATIAADTTLRDWARTYSGNHNFVFERGTTIQLTAPVDETTLFAQSQVPYNPMLYVAVPSGEPYNERRGKDLLTYQILAFLRPGVDDKPLDGIQDFVYYLEKVFQNIAYMTTGFECRFMTQIGESLDNPIDPDCITAILGLEYILDRGC